MYPFFQDQQNDRRDNWRGNNDVNDERRGGRGGRDYNRGQDDRWQGDRNRDVGRNFDRAGRRDDNRSNQMDDNRRNRYEDGNKFRSSRGDFGDSEYSSGYYYSVVCIK